MEEGLSDEEVEDMEVDDMEEVQKELMELMVDERKPRFIFI